MKIPRVQRKSKEGTFPGYKAEHQSILDKENPTTVPKTAIIGVYSEYEGGDTENQPICLECGSKLMHLSKSQKYLCTYSQCGKVYDAPDNTPLLTRTNQSMSPYQSQHYDPNNPEGELFFVSFNPDKGDVTLEKDYEVVYDTGRVKKVRCKGFPSDISINAFDD